MKKIVALILSLCLAMSMLAFASADAETKTGSAQGFASEVKVEMTIEDGKITALTVDDSGETYPSAGTDRAASVEKLIEAIKSAYYDDARLTDMRSRNIERACGYMDVSAYVTAYLRIAESAIQERSAELAQGEALRRAC